MKIGLTIGETDQHQMELNYERNSGDLTMSMDGARIFRDSTSLANKPPKHYELSVGHCEKRRIAFQLTSRDEAAEQGLPAIARLMITAIS